MKRYLDLFEKQKMGMQKKSIRKGEVMKQNFPTENGRRILRY